MSYIDAHVHVWNDDFTRYPIDGSFQKSDMKPPTFLPEELLLSYGPRGCQPYCIDPDEFLWF